MDEISLGLKHKQAQLKNDLAKALARQVELDVRLNRIAQLVTENPKPFPFGKLLAIAKGEYPDE